VLPPTVIERSRLLLALPAGGEKSLCTREVHVDATNLREELKSVRILWFSNKFVGEEPLELRLAGDDVNYSL